MSSSDCWLVRLCVHSNVNYLKSLHWLKINERIQYKILYLTFKLLHTMQSPYLYDLISLQTPRNTRSSSVVTLARPPTRSLKITSPFRYASPYLWNQLPHSLTHFVSHVLICLFLIHLFSKILSPHQCRHHHSYQSPHRSYIPNSKLSYFSNPTLHRHLAPLRTDFTDTRTALRLFSVSVFSSFQLSLFPSILLFLS